VVARGMRADTIQTPSRVPERFSAVWSNSSPSRCGNARCVSDLPEVFVEDKADHYSPRSTARSRAPDRAFRANCHARLRRFAVLLPWECSGCPRWAAIVGERSTAGMPTRWHRVVQIARARVALVRGVVRAHLRPRPRLVPASSATTQPRTGVDRLHWPAVSAWGLAVGCAPTITAGAPLSAFANGALGLMSPCRSRSPSAIDGLPGLS